MIELGDRVIQIPLDWPSRQGTVVALDKPSREARILWDDGRSEWIHEADFVNENIWLVKPRSEADDRVSPV